MAGSVLKPFVYGLALDEGLIHPASLLQDVPGVPVITDRNFDSGFHGPISMSEALVRSLNLPAVQVLEAYGPKRFAAKLRNVGLPLYLPERCCAESFAHSRRRWCKTGRYGGGLYRVCSPRQGR
ncbi:hypothetical protein DMI69_07795 [Escherichia coli]|nr:hypothetical protein [Escherichia coli]